MEDKRNITLFIDKRVQGIIQPNRTFKDINSSDFFITVALTKNAKPTDEYVEVFKDETKVSIERQEINPFFLELGLFNTVVKIEDSGDVVDKVKSIKGKSDRFNVEINN